MADGTFELSGRGAVLASAPFRNQFETAWPLPSQREDFAFIADQQMSVGAHLFILFQFIRAWRAKSAIIPHELQRRHLCAGRKLVRHHGRQRISLLVNPGGTGLDAEWMSLL